MKTYTVKVNQADIDKGRHRNSPCPVRAALKRATGKWWNVGQRAISLGNQLFYLPRNVSCWIRKFDDGFLSHPFTFKIKLP